MLEKRRVKAARLTILLVLVLLALLALWQCVESSLKSSSAQPILGILGLSGGDANPANESQLDGSSADSCDGLPDDPLALTQEGITFMDANDEMSILWYQSAWSITQSRSLIERSLILQGWQSMSTADEQVMSFVYASRGTASGGTLLMSFFSLEEGCSILIELL